MGLVVKPNTFAAGGSVVASEHNENYDTLYTLVNGKIQNTNVASDAAIADSKLAQITTASKVSAAAITSLANLPSGAGNLPSANSPEKIVLSATDTPTELTISGGALTVTQSYHNIDTEGDAATDNLDTINGGTEGALVVLSSANSARVPTLKDSTGNLRLAGDFALDNIRDTITLIYNATDASWHEISRSNNAA